MAKQAAKPQNASRNNPKGHTGNWWSDAGNWLDQEHRVLEAKGRQVYDAAIRAGKPIVANSVADLRALGAAAQKLERNAEHTGSRAAQAVASVARDPRSPEARRILRETGNQALAFAHGAGDSLPFDVADRASSAIRAFGGQGRWSDRYANEMVRERAQDRYEQANYGAARLGGQIAGTAAQMLVPLGELGVVAKVTERAARPLGSLAARYVPKALTEFAEHAIQPAVRTVPVRVKGVEPIKSTAMNLPEQFVTSAAGAASNVGAQIVADLSTGHRSEWKDYLIAAGVGGLQGRFSHRFSPALTGAVGGAATSIGQDLADNGSLGWDDAAGAAGSALLGGALGHHADRWATRRGERLDWRHRASHTGLIPQSKGRMGELMGKGRSYARFERPVKGPHRFAVDEEGHYSVPDQYVADLFARPDPESPRLAEHKFEGGQVSPRQYQALQKVGADNFRLDSFKARDLGVLLGLPIANLVTRERDAAGEDDAWRRPPLLSSYP